MTKKLILYFAFVSFFIVSCANENESFEHENETASQEQRNDDVNENTEDNSSEKETDTEDVGELEELEEYEEIEKNIDLSQYTPHIVEDNINKRIILFHDAQDKENYKSIYIKEESYLKIIEYNQGLIYNSQL